MKESERAKENERCRGREGERKRQSERESERALFMSLGVLLSHALWELLVLLSNSSAGQGD